MLSIRQKTGVILGMNGILGAGILGAALILPLFCADINAEVFRWVDEQGRVHYGDKPPDDDADQIEIEEAPAPDPVIRQRYREQQKLLDRFEEDREEQSVRQQQDEREREQWRVECAEAENRITQLHDVPLLYEKTDERGEPIVFSDEERKTKEAELRSFIRKHCQNL